MIKLLLARHGLTDWNKDNRFQGQADIPLNPTGAQQALALGQMLSTEALDRIYVSTLSRAGETARAIAAFHPCPVIVEPRLREISWGKWEGMTYAEIQQEYPEFLRMWETRDPEASSPGGESIAQLASRLQPFLDDLARDAAGKTVLIVSHGGVMQVMLCLLLGVSPGLYWQFRISQASLTEVMYSPPERGIIYRLNETCHLEALTLPAP
jgi:phosphoserine phosphatase